MGTQANFLAQQMQLERQRQTQLHQQAQLQAQQQQQQQMVWPTSALVPPFQQPAQ